MRQADVPEQVGGSPSSETDRGAPSRIYSQRLQTKENHRTLKNSVQRKRTGSSEGQRPGAQKTVKRRPTHVSSATDHSDQHGPLALHPSDSRNSESIHPVAVKMDGERDPLAAAMGWDGPGYPVRGRLCTAWLGDPHTAWGRCVVLQDAGP